MTTLSCQQKDAESILRSLGREGIENILDAELLNTAQDYEVQITANEKNSYILYIDLNYHLYAIQENNAQGKFIYREVE